MKTEIQRNAPTIVLTLEQWEFEDVLKMVDHACTGEGGLATHASLRRTLHWEDPSTRNRHSVRAALTAVREAL